MSNALSPADAHDLTALLSNVSSNTVQIPSADTVVSLLTQRYRLEHTATYIGDSNLVVLNPFQVLPDSSDASQAEYEDRSHKARSGEGGETVQPHAYDLACRVFLMMQRTKETQSVVFSGISGSGSSTQQDLFTSQILRMSTMGKKDARIAEQVRSLSVLLRSFGCAKTATNPCASRYSKVLELHFTAIGRLAGAKALTFGLDKTRVYKLSRQERSFNVFYQLLAGATAEEREALCLFDNVTSYSFLQSSGTYQLQSGPHSDESIELDNLRVAMRTLGFSPRHISAIFRLLSAILLLGNITFEDKGQESYNYESAWVANRDVLEACAKLLGVEADGLEKSLTNQVRWVRKETVANILSAEGSVGQRDSLMSSLYSILFAFVVETANHKIFPGDEAIATLQAQGGSSILQLDIPGFHTNVPERPGSGVLLRALNGFEEFQYNFTNEIVHFWLAELEFDGDIGTAARAQEDGVRVADVIPPDGTARLELLRGGRVGGKADTKPGGLLGGLSKTCGSLRKGTLPETADDELLLGMRDHFGAHTAFMSSPSGPGAKSAFGISHFGGAVVYDASGFVKQNVDAFDTEFVALMRHSEDGFLAKLVSGPGLAAEVHPLDHTIIVAAQVCSQPLRRPSPINSLNAAPPSQIDFTLPLIDPLEIYPLTTQLNAVLSQLLKLIERTRVWSVISLRPNDNGNPRSIDAKRLRGQVAAYLLPELIARKKVDYVADYGHLDFCHRHGVSGTGPDSVEDFLSNFSNIKKGVDYDVGNNRVWLSYGAWKLIEDRLRLEEPPERRTVKAAEGAPMSPFNEGRQVLDQTGNDKTDPGFVASRSTFAGGEWNEEDSPARAAYATGGSVDDLLLASDTPGENMSAYGSNVGYGYRNTATVPAPYVQATSAQSDVWGDDNKEEVSGFSPAYPMKFETGVINLNGEPTNDKGVTVEEVPASRGRRMWVALVWALTWWIPDVTLKYLGRMKRPDVRLAWREKVALCLLIGVFCCTVIFYIVIFGRLLCPNFDKAWNVKEVGFHGGGNDYWVSVRGQVYDLTKFYRIQHSDIVGETASASDMLTLAGMDLTNYFPIPLTTACPSLVNDRSLTLQPLNFTADLPTAVHTSGSQQPVSSSELFQQNWYYDIFLPKMQTMHKGPLVVAPKAVLSDAENNGRIWAIYNNKILDLTDYFNTITIYATNNAYVFLDKDLTDVWAAQPGTDITQAVADLNLDSNTLQANMDCINNLFYQGEPDFRLTPRCQVQPNLLLAFSVLIMSTILVKFLAALQFGSKRMPEMRDKFVICQVPCYTEGEESLKKTIDSLATLTYDDKRKLLMIICDGMIVGSGNDRPTPRIVLDILGVDQNNDPDPLMFKSIAEGSKQLNYAKVWSGLYEVEGHVVPYVVVAKVGRPSERSRPGNRGKRDSQVLCMRFLNRVHFDSEMYPLELEMYHQIKNVIGVDPQLYEYMLVIDADTSVAHDSLNRLVSCAADDSRVIGICGETKLDNEQASWWTMIQVYEYFISHHMAKAFESLFGSVTCLPGCFTMYRLRTADKGKPLLISSLVIDDYSESNLDTLHKKNLLSLGEDRYLTTLILKHFPNFKTKFEPNAQAMTVAPDRWKVLISQRRRWINSTVHNLAELAFLPDMCGFCCFGMRFVVMLDLVGTLILPATFVYMIYLIVTVATGTGIVPIISIVMIAAVYGLQAVIFLLKRQWQFIGWLLIYLLAYPIYSFILPLYSFWRFDDFSWGNTRVVVGEGKNKKIIQNEEEAFDENSIPMKKFADYEAAIEMDDGKSVRSFETRHTQSTAGFSLATKLPPGSYQGGGDYYRDTVQSRAQSRSAFNKYPNPQRQSYMESQPGSVHGGGSEFGYPTARSSYGGGFVAPPSHAGFGGYPVGSLGSMGGHMSSMSFPGFAPQSVAGLPRPPSSFSMNPFFTAGSSMPVVSNKSDPSNEELVTTLKSYLAQQDLMKVTKRTAREGLAALFPQANLDSKKDFINQSIDAVLQGRL